MGIYNNKITLDFDTSRFGEDINLSTNMKFYLTAQKSMVKDWQLEDMNNDKEDSFYYQNPVLASIESCNTEINSIHSLCHINAFVNPNVMNILSNTATTSNSITKFIRHTNRLSGLSSTNSSNVPTLNSALNIGKQVLVIANKSDDINDQTPILGNFTSLYVKDDITSTLPAIITANNTITNSIANGVIYLTDEQVNTITDNILILKNLIDERREHDVKFYNDSCNLVSQYHTTMKHSSVDDIDKNVLKLIATNELKSRLGI